MWSAPRRCAVGLGEEGAERLRVEHDAIVGAAVAAHRGVVVKHLGDGVMATFTSAANASAAAVGLQQQIERANRGRDGPAIAVRVGLAVGDVTFDGDDCFGLPVVEAQRLEASATPASIRCSELVTRLAGGRGGYECVPLGAVSLKGLPEPVPAVEVSWAPLPESAAIPPLLAQRDVLPFCGRATELDRLVASWKRVADGGQEVLFVAGEPGVGKTRLCQELAAVVAESGGLVLAGACDLDVSVPFQPFAAALHWHLEQGSVRDAATLGRHAGDLARIAPRLADMVADLPQALVSEPDVERARLFQAIESWLAATAARRPTLFVVDDVHWADPSSLQVLRHLSEAPAPGLLTVCTFRDTEVDTAHLLSSTLADLRRTGTVTRLSLDGLDADGVCELIVRSGGHADEATATAFATTVLVETSGNPFFVGEVLRDLAESGRWSGEFGPEVVSRLAGVREVVAQRLARLGSTTEGVLGAAAVFGLEFDVGPVAAVVGLSEDDVIEALDLAQHAHLVREVDRDRYRFEHALVRDTLYAGLSASRRARQHRKAAEALEVHHADAIDDVVVDLAVHWRAATVGGDPQKAIHYALAAADQAAARRAPETAGNWYSTAIELLNTTASSTDPGLVHALAGLAEARFGCADPAWPVFAKAAARAAIGAGDATRAHRVLTLSSRVVFRAAGPADPDKIALLREALSVLDDLRVDQRAQLLASLATELMFVGSWAERRRRLGERDALLGQLALVERARVLSDMGALSLATHSPTQITEFAATIEAALDHERDPYWLAQVASCGGLVAMISGNRQLMERAFSTTADAAAELSSPWLDGLIAFAHGVMLPTIDGRLDEAEAALPRAREVFAVADPADAALYAWISQLALSRERGTLGTLAGRCARYALGQPAEHFTRAIHALACLAAGDPAPAEKGLVGLNTDAIADDSGWSLTVACWADVAADVGGRAECQALCAVLAPHSGGNAATGGWFYGPVDRLLGRLHVRLGRPDEADAEMAAAVDLARAMATPPWIARSHLDWAEALATRGDVRGGRAQLDAAVSAMADLELPESRQRIVALRPIVAR